MAEITDKQQIKLDKIVSDLKRLSRELGKPNITIADCRSTGGEYGITWARNNCQLNFNELKTMAGLPINGKGASSYGKRGIHSMVLKEGGMRYCNKCEKKFQRTNINRAICPKCSDVNAHESDDHVSIFSSGHCKASKGRS